MDINNFIKDLNVKVFVEIGCHNGKDTINFRKAHPHARIVCFEPDPRNLNLLEKNNTKDIAEIYPFAVSNQNGKSKFYQSSGVCPIKHLADEFGDWSLSSSLKTPTGHLSMHRWVTFPKTAEVSTIRLDDFEPLKNTIIDFMWVDVQGAEDLVFSGAKETLKNTRYVYTEYSNTELYQGQLTRDQILELFGLDWKVEYDFGGDVLLHNILFGSN